MDERIREVMERTAQELADIKGVRINAIYVQQDAYASAGYLFIEKDEISEEDMNQGEHFIGSFFPQDYANLEQK